MTTRISGPKWLRDLAQLLPVRPHYVLTGNIRDLVLLGEPGRDIRAVPALDAIWETLAGLGYEAMLVWEPVSGLRAFPQELCRSAVVAAATDRSGGLPEPLAIGSTELATIVHRVSVPPAGAEYRVALVVDSASRLANESGIFVQAERAVLEARLVPLRAGQSGVEAFNPVIWLSNRPNDLPYWFGSDNERVRTLAVPLPEADDRRRAAEIFFAELVGEKRLGDFARSVTGLTDGLTINGLQDVSILAESSLRGAGEDMGRARRALEETIRAYRVGDTATRSPWQGDELRRRIRDAESGPAEKRLANRVKGQDRAVTRVFDVLKRTSIGLTGAQVKGSASRPRGVLFFAGPTGVGKTEMSKAIAEIVFGDETAYRRFDMSEFSAEHSADRLIGSPPGYVGFDQGGELTNAMLERPFRVLLFDEIEKAHPKILDKFLQILEDGRLTDGRGRTVYFSDALIVFTSNAGIVRRISEHESQYLVTQEQCENSPAEYEAAVIKGVGDYFVHGISPPRPELLNRMGENIVVFNFINRSIGYEILRGMVDTVIARIRTEHDIELRIGDGAMETLRALCVDSDLSMGGRKIGSQLEAKLVNPLGRYLFERLESCADLRGQHIEITQVQDSNNDGIYEIVVA